MSKLTKDNDVTVPDLDARCGSWIAVCRNTGRPVLETYSRRVAEAIDQRRYELLTALEWLQRFNRAVRIAECTAR